MTDERTKTDAAEKIRNQAEACILGLSHLTVGYRGVPLVSDMNVAVKKGSVLALIGPNGAGKSTVLKTIAGQLPPVGGEVVFDGKPLASYGGAGLAKRMAALFSQRRAAADMTVFEVVAAGRYPYTGYFDRLKKEDVRVVEEALAFVGMSEYTHRKFAELSDGQRQRVWIARSIAQQPALVVMDEPTAFLDVRYKIEILTVLRRLADERGVTVVMSLHDVDLARRTADHVLAIAAAHTWEFGEADSIITEEKMRKLFGVADDGKDLRFAGYRFW